jgi:hypothetical protein
MNADQIELQTERILFAEWLFYYRQHRVLKAMIGPAFDRAKAQWDRVEAYRLEHGHLPNEECKCPRR